MELQDFINIVRHGNFIVGPFELRLIERIFNQKEIKELFELIRKDDPHYQPYYTPYEKGWDLICEIDDEERKRYKEYLKTKIKEYYQSQDIILARKETKGGVAYHYKYSGKCQVLMMANKNVYEMPPHIDEYSQNADTYFKRFHDKMRHVRDLQGRIHTLSKCRRYEDYFVVELPDTFDCTTVSLENKKIKQFVEEFKMKYRKQ